MQSKRIHFIAIGGSVMANLALALKESGHTVSGSDDELYNPSKSRLQSKGLLPNSLGWFPDKLDKTIDAVILGMHAKKDNPELLKAQRLGVPIYSFPDYIVGQSQDKQRIVIGGSHGKTTITALLIHVLSYHKRKFDYVVGAQIDGIENTVQLTDAPIILIEGDEYPSSALDSTPKFIKYKHHVGVISGVAWDHANVFTSKEHYVEQFKHFANLTPKGGLIIYNAEDAISNAIGKINRPDITAIPYKAYKHMEYDGMVLLKTKDHKETPIQLFGLHNIQNIAAAWKVLSRIGISKNQFYEALPHFKGAANRLSVVFKNDSVAVYKDFAHSPSKVRASTKAVKGLYPKRVLVGCLELHTLSSLNRNFLPEYRNSMDACAVAIIYYNPDKIKAITAAEIRHAFGNKALKIFTDSTKLASYITAMEWSSKNLLMMSAGNFNALDLTLITQQIAAKKTQSTL